MFRFQATHFDHSRTGLGRRHPVNETQPSLKFNVDLKEYHASLDGTNTKQGRVRAGDGNRWKFNSMKIVAFHSWNGETITRTSNVWIATAQDLASGKSI